MTEARHDARANTERPVATDLDATAVARPAVAPSMAAATRVGRGVPGPDTVPGSGRAPAPGTSISTTGARTATGEEVAAVEVVAVAVPALIPDPPVAVAPKAPLRVVVTCGDLSETRSA